MIDLTAKKYQFEEAIETPLPKNTRANLLMQFLLLFQRHLICMKRNYVSDIILPLVIFVNFSYPFRKYYSQD